jgi:hypothetical protein
MNLLRQSVIDVWHAFSQPFEGREAGMYLDTHDPPLVTCAVGCLIDPIGAALALPWKRDSDGTPANQDEIRTAWSLLKSRPEYSRRSAAAARKLTGLHLDDADIDALVSRLLAANAAAIVHWFPMFADYPADAQLGIMSMAWAAGAGFATKFPRFKTAVLAGNWLSARDECTLQEAKNPGVVPRNKANRVCFANAEIITRCGLDRAALCWPQVAQAEVHAAERPVNLGDIVVTALDDARLHDEALAALQESRFRLLDEFRAEARLAMSMPDDEEVTRVERRKGA